MILITRKGVVTLYNPFIFHLLQISSEKIKLHLQFHTNNSISSNLLAMEILKLTPTTEEQNISAFAIVFHPSVHEN